MEVLVRDLVGTKNAARLLGVTRNAVYYYKRRGTLGTVKIDDTFFYLRQDVEALAAERALAAESKAVNKRKGKKGK